MAVGVVLHYLDATHHRQFDHLRGIRRRPDEGMWLDRFTVRNLEILHPNHPDGTTLVDVLGPHVHAHGRPCVATCFVAPLTDLKAIEARHDAVDVSLKK